MRNCARMLQSSRSGGQAIHLPSMHREYTLGPGHELCAQLVATGLGFICREHTHDIMVQRLEPSVYNLGKETLKGF